MWDGESEENVIASGRKGAKTEDEQRFFFFFFFFNCILFVLSNYNQRSFESIRVLKQVQLRSDVPEDSSFPYMYYE